MIGYLKIGAGCLFLFVLFGCATGGGNVSSNQEKIEQQARIPEEPLIMIKIIDDLDAALIITPQTVSVVGKSIGDAFKKSGWYEVSSADADRPIDVVCHLDADEGIRFIAQCKVEGDIKVNGKSISMPSSQGSILFDKNVLNTYETKKTIIQLIMIQEMDAVDAAEKKLSLVVE